MTHTIKTTNIDLTAPFLLNDILIDAKRSCLSKNQQEQNIQPKHLQVLMYLSSKKNQIVSTDELITNCWHSPFISDSPVHKCIAQLRKLLGDNSKDPKFIKTYAKKGYMLIASIAQPVHTSTQFPNNLDSEPFFQHAYRQNQQQLFFGREQVIKEFLATMSAAIDQTNYWLMLGGEKQIGKSSLIHAGIIPQLQTAASAFNKVIVLDVRHCHHLSADVTLLEQLKNAQVLANDKPLTFYLSILKNQPEQLINDIKTQNFILVIDHFETLLSPNKQTKASHNEQVFFTLIKVLLASKKCFLITALTSHYIEMMTHLASANALTFQQFIVPNFSYSEIREIITLTTKSASLCFQYHKQSRNTLDNLIIEQWLAKPFPINIVQQQLAHLYQKRNENILTYQAWQVSGGLPQSLAQLITTNIKQLSNHEKRDFEQLLFQLITLNDNHQAIATTGLLTSQVASNIPTKSIIKFTDMQLLNLDSANNITLIHPTIINHCSYLKAWIKGNFNNLQLLKELNRLSKRWLFYKKDRQFLIHSNKQLTELMQVINEKNLILPHSELSFVALSQKKYRQKIQNIWALLLLTVLVISIALINLAHRNEPKVKSKQQYRVKQPINIAKTLAPCRYQYKNLIEQVM